MQGVERVVVVQDVADVQLVDLRDGADVAGDDAVDLVVRLAVQVEDVAEFHGLLRMADDDLGLAGHDAAVDAEDRQLPDEWIGRDLEDVGDRLAGDVLGVGKRLDDVFVVADHHRPGVALERAGEPARDELEQFRHADAAVRVDEQHRHDVPFIEAALERVVQGGIVGLVPAEVRLHEVFVALDDLVEDRLVGGRHVEDVGGALIVEQALHDGFATVRGQIHGLALGAESCLDARDEAFEPGFGR